MARISRRRLAVFGSAIVVAVVAANPLAWRAWHPAESRQTPVITVGPRRGRDIYDRACRSLSAQRLPALSELVDHNHTAASSDLRAYTLTASLAHRFGDDRVNELLRSSGDVPVTLGTNWRAIDADWHECVREVCAQ